MEKKAWGCLILVVWLITWCVINPWGRGRELGPVHGESARIFEESLGEVTPKTAPARARSKAYATVDMVLASEIRALDGQVSDVPLKDRIESLMRRREAWVRTFDISSSTVRFMIKGDDESSYTVHLSGVVK